MSVEKSGSKAEHSKAEYTIKSIFNRSVKQFAKRQLQFAKKQLQFARRQLQFARRQLQFAKRQLQFAKRAVRKFAEQQLQLAKRSAGQFAGQFLRKKSSRSDSPELPSQLYLQEENQRLLSTLETTTLLSSSLHLDVVLDSLLDKGEDICNSEASSLMLVDEERHDLYFHTIKGHSSEVLQDIRLNLGEGIAGWVAQEGSPVLVPDCSKDPRFFRQADQRSHFQTRTMMCVPLRIRNRIIGTIQVLNRRDRRPFDAMDLKIFTVLADQAAIAIHNARLHKMATVDSMTSLYMKSYFMARLEEEFLHARHSRDPVSLLMSDIDHFKRINDRFGHPGGDKALAELAAVLREIVHKLDSDDIAGRYGGEEFCVLLPGSDAKRAEEVGNLICDTIRDRPIQIGDQAAPITISIGVSAYPLHAEHITKAEDLVRLADEALYICKRRGRDCVSLYDNHGKAL